MIENLDYLHILKCLKSLPFNVGKKTLVELLLGKSNPTIKRNELFLNENYAILAKYSSRDLEGVIDKLVLNDFIGFISMEGNKFAKLLGITRKGIDEIDKPTIEKNKMTYSQNKTIITDTDKLLFNSFNYFLDGYNDDQKKGIVSNSKKILCLAGAGSGKTTVLTKRIEFLTKYRSISEEKILAITFTKKARAEMKKRLNQNGLFNVSIETFNSFCERILRKHNDLVYNRPMRVIGYRDKILMIRRALERIGSSIDKAVTLYFSPKQRRDKSADQLANIFMNDCFFIRDYFKFKNIALNEDAFGGHEKLEKNPDAKLVYHVSKYLEAFMLKNGLRDFADQLIDALKLFNEKPNLIPQFDHILIDEYQDVNSTQVELIDVLNPTNIFAVGDPRQSIYGWRGSDLRFILNFENKYEMCETISLIKNYRSSKSIVNLINSCIKNMDLPDLESSSQLSTSIELIGFKNNASEYEFIVEKIKTANIPLKEIFVLARTNRVLNELSQILKQKKINHVLKTDEMKNGTEEEYDGVTLATIHSIKGLEAETVFVMACNSNNFPVKASDHPVVDMVKIDEYDKEEEERRLFYVALSRAKKTLYLTYTGRSTYFIDNDMLAMTGSKNSKLNQSNSTASLTLFEKLKEWRLEQAKITKLPAYMILNDASLIELSQKKPSNLIDLERIRGMGPVKIQKYGEELLELIH